MIEGVGKDAPIVANAAGGKQSHSPYRCDLLDGKVILGLSKVLAHGAARYEPNNWRKLSREENINHCLVHIFSYMAGDTQDDHLSHALCRLMFALATEEDGNSFPQGVD